MRIHILQSGGDGRGAMRMERAYRACLQQKLGEMRGRNVVFWGGGKPMTGHGGGVHHGGQSDIGEQAAL